MASETEKTLRSQLRALGEERTPDRTAILVDLATLMDDQGRSDEATELYHQALLNSPLDRGLDQQGRRVDGSSTGASASGDLLDDVEDSWENGGWESGLEKLKLADTPPGLSESSHTNGNAPSTAKRRGSSSRTKPSPTNGVLGNSIALPPGLSEQPGGGNSAAVPPGLISEQPPGLGSERQAGREGRLSGLSPSRPQSNGNHWQPCISQGAELSQQPDRDQIRSPVRPSSEQHQSRPSPSSQCTESHREPAREERKAGSPYSRERPGFDWQSPRPERASGTFSSRSTPQRTSAPSPSGNHRSWSDWSPRRTPGVSSSEDEGEVPLGGKHILEVCGLKASTAEAEVDAYLAQLHRFAVKPAVKWADDTHALAVFSDITAAHDAKEGSDRDQSSFLWLKSYDQASSKCRNIAPSELQPPRLRPATTDVVARRLVGSALNMSHLRDRAGERALMQQRRENVSERARRKVEVEARRNEAWGD